MDGDRQITARSAVSAPMLDTSKFTLVHSGPRHRLYRGRTTDGDIVVKLAAAGLPAAHAVMSIRHEYELLRDLDLHGVVRVLGLAQTNEGLALLMEDVGASTLADQIRSGPLSVADFLDVAFQLSEAIASIHGARVVHRDIHPGNIVWDARSRRVTLNDFGLATTLPALTVESASPNLLEGTLAYVSPEQTGRTGRSVDSRTDLYSLGASFYEMLTGGPPFASRDPIELVHAHIARRPLPPHELNPEAPIALSRIVLKLLEKEPERRYQTAQGLAVDLCEARSQWLADGTVLPFPLGRRDLPWTLSISDKLYGRDEALRTLREAFARVCQGERELVLVTGAPGVGKSALVRHLGPAVTEHRGLYIAGKFDQLQRSIPFSGLAQAFRELARQLLTEVEPVLATWRERIKAAVAPNGQILVDIVPELERMLGPQPAVPEVGPVESKNRFHLVFAQFLRVFAQPEHPLVLFLDDLQWADAASLQLLEQWLGDAAGHHLLLLGAYRSNEVGSSHPLALSLAGLRGAGILVDEIHLWPIGADDVAQLVAEAVNKDVAKTRPLADLIMHKTAGNPFFVRRLLHLLHAQGLIRLEPLTHAWEWDLTELEHAPLADNVLDLMVHSIQRLPVQTRALLETGACIGHRFDLGMLAEVSGLSRTAATDQLWPALEDGLLLALRETYRAPRRAGPLDRSLDALPQMVQFAHDRVQQAAYSLPSEERRREIHLGIGRHMLNGAGEGQLDERLFDIVDQLDLGEALIVDPAERLRLAELNLAAGRKARASAAYHAAVEYLTVAMRNLPARPWHAQPALTFALHREFAEYAYLTGRHARAEEMIETALGHALSKVAKADLYSLRVLAATVAGDWSRALRWGREGLAVFGLEWPLEDLADATEVEAAAVMKNVGGRRIEDLLEEPEVSDAETRACMRLLSILCPPAYFSGADVLTFLVTRATNLSLVHGPSPYSAFAYALYAGLHNARTGEYDVGYAFGRLALGIARLFGSGAEESRTLEVFGLVVHPWKAPLRDSLPLLREGFRVGVESGELAYAAFNLNSMLINGLPAGVPLTDLLADADAAIEFATRHENRTSVEMAFPFRQISRALMGGTRAAATLDDDGFEEAQFLDEARGNQTALGFFWVAKLQATYLAGDYETARRSSREGAGPVLAGNIGMVTSAEHVFYTALTLSAEYARVPGGRPEALDELRGLHRKLIAWAEHAPENFAHKAALVGAEIARVGGASIEAMKLYRTAIDDASRQLFLQDEALAHELRARFLLGEQEPDLAAVHFRAARERYHRWGALVKVRSLEIEHPGLFVPEPQTRGQGTSIDALALIKASQAISAESTPDRLFERILRVVAEVAGAQNGALVLCDAEAFTVRARIETAEEVTVSLEEAPLDRFSDLPWTVLRYVFRSNEPLVLSDAGEGAFAADPAVRRRKVRSVLCVPLTSQAKVVGLLYLENETMAGAFAERLVEIVQILAAQAAISLENSTLVGALQRLTGVLEERVTERTRQLADEVAARDKVEAALRQSQKMEAVGQLTGGLAHDFNNLLTGIMGSLELLNTRIRQGRLTEIDRYTAAAQGAAKRAAALTHRLLAFSRRQTLDPKPTDMNRLVSGMEELLRRTVGPEIAVETVAAGGLWTTLVDPNQLENALLNLCINARDAMPDGGKLTIETGNKWLDVQAARECDLPPGQYASLCVSDTGCGMAPDVARRAFDPFFTTKPIGVGTGLGLSMVYGFVRQSGGQARIYSEPGQGASVCLYLPRHLGAAERADAAAEPAEVPRAEQGETVLVVDDEPTVRMLVTEVLEDLGYTAIEAADGADALKVLRSEVHVDLLVTDVGLPGGMNGRQVADAARDLRPGLKVLFITGYAENAVLSHGHLDPGMHVLTKPFAIEALATRIKDLILD